MVYLRLSIIKIGRSVGYATKEARMAQNKKRTEDLRVRRTRKLLMQALIELTIEKGFSAITVQDIADRAMVNRATFYRHYLDKHDLLDKYMNEVYELTAAQEELSLEQTQEAASGKAPVGMVRMLEHVQRHADFYRVMLGAKGDPAFVQRIQQYSELRLHSLLPDSSAQVMSKSPPVDLCINYLSHAGVGALAWWLKEGQSYPPEQVAAWLNQLNQATLEHTFGEAATKP
jgi:AcrR family transcriptional regulator